MRYSWTKTLCVVVFSAAGMLAAVSIGAQNLVEKDGVLVPKPKAPDIGTYLGEGYVVPKDRAGSADWNPLERPHDYAIKVAEYRSAQDGPDKDAKKAELKKKLAEIFDVDMKARKAQADEIETRLKKLQEQYKSREAAKERIIDLQIEVLEKDAEGLGFPKEVTARKAKATPEESRNSESMGPRGRLMRTFRSLKELLQLEGDYAEELKKKGLFVVSADEKIFAHVEHGPNGASLVMVRDAATGRSLANYQTKDLIAEIRFQEGGVGVRTQEGKFEMLIPLETVLKLGGSAEKPLANRSLLNVADAGAGELDEYSRIRKAYLGTKAQLVNANEDLKKRLEDAKKANPEASEDQLKAIVQQTANYRDSVESRQREATTILETKLKLLALDLESARASFNVAEGELAKAQHINESKRNAVNEIEFRRLQLSMEKQKVDVMRAQTMLDLFKSIKADGEPKPEALK